MNRLLSPHSFNRPWFAKSENSGLPLTTACTRRPCRVQAASSGTSPKGERLSKVLASAGVASRRGAEELIFSGKVEVNGSVVSTPQTRIQTNKDRVTLDGVLVRTRVQEQFYFAVNKPTGFICTSNRDSPEVKNKKIVLDLFEGWMCKWKEEKPKGMLPPRLFTVGRLDGNSWGLIFVTTDGNWAQKIAHPSSGLTKEYVVHPNHPPSAQELGALRKGCVMDGRMVVPNMVYKDLDFVRVIVSEGRNREVRKLFESAGLKVKSLKRVRIGGYQMPSSMKVGSVRQLMPKDLRKVLDRSVDPQF